MLLLLLSPENGFLRVNRTKGVRQVVMFMLDSHVLHKKKCSVRETPVFRLEARVSRLEAWRMKYHYS